mmetsp:Transcript_6657/g.13397  ORF Transcript_6657/g.13397 Transcript_6657/m.13397 type:complete len:400 (+) Transcript_6657:19-1218(+)|eukprot:CAMPEP_0196746778 /NCGR_PEP_ID=MMETSP1091-20130531/67068_1 /TAXON_ID=302021 /ORGANISM="Rhodomonas sp., Strain CCMP768" /LENGTH=399 /DNA_ID=CAMNT_0042093801 /DNA_START=17 /DNA_END=1216 /DNA_ORIENTATION=-
MKLSHFVVLSVVWASLCKAHTYSTSSGAIFEESTVAKLGETIITHQSMTRRYREMVPPRASEQRDPERRLRAPTKAEEAVFILDMDKTSIYGNDSNDLAIALQWMEKPESVVRGLYKKIVSPCIRPAYEQIQKSVSRLNTVIYTRRPQVVQYSSCFREGVVIPVQYKEEWHHGGQICFPSYVKDADEILETYDGPELLANERYDIKNALERLIAARDAVTEELGLAEPPRVVVTATEKQVESTLKALKLPTENAVLFDDNRALLSDPKVVCVEPFEKLPEPMCTEVKEYMEEHLPCYQLESDLVNYLMGAKPEEVSLQKDPWSDRLQWRLPRMTLDPLAWRVPKFESPAQRKDGTVSPVTPPEEAEHALELRQSGLKQFASLRAAAERAVELRSISSEQ